MVKAKCQASMKRLKRDVQVTINRKTSKIENSVCTCPAGASSYCNHVMALVLELADYSLKGLKEVPIEVACTSQARKWGIPGESDSFKEPIMGKSIFKNLNKRDIGSTLYDPRNNHDEEMFNERLEILESSLKNQHKNIAFAHCITSKENRLTESTMFGNFFIGSPLSYHLLAVDFSFKILSNIPIGERNAL